MFPETEHNVEVMSSEPIRHKSILTIMESQGIVRFSIGKSVISDGKLSYFSISSVYRFVDAIFSSIFSVYCFVDAIFYHLSLLITLWNLRSKEYLQSLLKEKRSYKFSLILWFFFLKKSRV